MIKPKRLEKGNTIAIVSLSSGMGGEKEFFHRYLLGKKRLEKYGLNVITMPNTLKGIEYLKNHPEKRAEDLMNAFKDKNIKGIFSMIGGDDTIRLLPFIDFDIIKNNPKVFMGYSDTTVNHFMMNKAGLVSYYGPSILCEFAENGKMHDYTKKYVQEVLFENKENIVIKSSKFWTNERLDWTVEENDVIERKMNNEKHGYEVLQGQGFFEGVLIGGCVDVFIHIIGTNIWPEKDYWNNKILFLETSEEKISPQNLTYILRNLATQGIFNKISGIIFGKPKDETYYEEYKEVLKNVIGTENKKYKLPILYNVNFGHTAPMCILPIGIKVRVDLNKKEIVFLEKPMGD